MESLSRNNRRRKRRHESSTRHSMDSVALPIINIDSSASQVELEKPERPTPKLATTARRFNKIGQRYARNDDEASNRGVKLNLCSITQNTPMSPSASQTIETLKQKSFTTLPSPRGSDRVVDPIIRSHLRNSSQDPKLPLAFMTDNAHSDSKRSLSLINKDSHANISISLTNNTQSNTQTSGRKRQKKVDFIKDLGAKKPNPHLNRIKDIISKVRELRGGNPTISNLMAETQKVKKEMLAQEFRNSSITNTVNQVDLFIEYQPNILKWLYDEMQESLEDAVESER